MDGSQTDLYQSGEEPRYQMKLCHKWIAPASGLHKGPGHRLVEAGGLVLCYKSTTGTNIY